MAALTDPGRGFDAVTIGDTRSAFSACQYDLVVSLCSMHDAHLWVPEIEGPVMADSAAHEKILMELFWGAAP